MFVVVFYVFFQKAKTESLTKFYFDNKHYNYDYGWLDLLRGKANGFV